MTRREPPALRHRGKAARRSAVAEPRLDDELGAASRALESHCVQSAEVLSLQRLAGNAAVTRLLARSYAARKKPRVKFGSKGPALVDVHRKLNWIPKPQLSVEDDAWADMETIGQVYHFQARHSLKPDGIVGPDTHDALEDWAAYYSGWQEVGGT